MELSLVLDCFLIMEITAHVIGGSEGSVLRSALASLDPHQGWDAQLCFTAGLLGFVGPFDFFLMSFRQRAMLSAPF